MNELICPFRIKPPNECLMCGSALVLSTTEVILQEVDSAGHPSSMIDHVLNRKLYCPICGQRYEVWLDEDNMVVRPANKNPTIVSKDKIAMDKNPFGNIL